MNPETGGVEQTPEPVETAPPEVAEYISYYIDSPTLGEAEAAKLFLGDRVEDLQNPNYVAAMCQRLQLSDSETARITSFVEQLINDRVAEVADQAEATPEVGEAATVEVTQDSTPEMVAEEVVYQSKEEAVTAMEQNIDAMAAELAALQLDTEDPFKTHEAFFAILKKYAVAIELPGGDVVDGIPVSLSQSNIPEAERGDWGSSGGDKISTGSLSSLKRIFSLDRVTAEGFDASLENSQVVHPEVIAALNAVFNKS